MLSKAIISVFSTSTHSKSGGLLIILSALHTSRQLKPASTFRHYPQPSRNCEGFVPSESASHPTLRGRLNSGSFAYFPGLPEIWPLYAQLQRGENPLQRLLLVGINVLFHPFTITFLPSHSIQCWPTNTLVLPFFVSH